MIDSASWIQKELQLKSSDPNEKQLQIFSQLSESNQLKN